LQDNSWQRNLIICVRYFTKMTEMCVRAYGSNPNNSATYGAILNLIIYLKKY